MSSDARVNAWAASWKALDAARAFAEEVGEHGLTEMPDHYWGVLHAASTLAQLASAPAAVGESAAALIAAEEQHKREATQRITDALRKAGR